MPGVNKAPAQLAQPSDRDQIISFLLARGDERDKTIHELQEGLAVALGQSDQIQQQRVALQNQVDQLKTKLAEYEATKAAQVLQTAEATTEGA